MGIAFLHGNGGGGSGGGGGLNFQVVGGTTEPENPKENTIWVNTDTAISSYAFAAVVPETPVEGMVWITTGMSSAVEFNILKKNAVQVYPLSAKQYVDGVWVDVEAMTYRNGEWTKWSLDLFNAGDQNEELTGGWLQTLNSGAGSGSGVVGSSNMVLTVTTATDANNQHNVSVSHRTPVDVSPYGKLEATLTNQSGGSNAWFCVGLSTQNTHGWDSSAWLSKAGGYGSDSRTVYEADIKSITGKAYIVCNAMTSYRGTAKITVTTIRLIP